MSDVPESPRPVSRFGFQWGHYRYEVHGPVSSHPDYRSPLLATRQLLLPGLSPDVGQSQLVELTALTEEYGPAALQRCIEQVRRAGFIRHPNAAGVWGAVFDEKTPYILMEHLRGCSLLALMEAALSLGRRLSPAFVAYVGVELADVLEYAHRKKDEEEQPLHVVHRAVGPMWIRVGVTGRIQLTHFGVAYSKLLDRLHAPGQVLRADAAYAAPELLRGFFENEGGGADPLTPPSLDGRADVFSLGLVLLELLLACYARNARELLWRDLKARFPPSVHNEAPALVKLETLANRVLHFGPMEVLRAADEVPEPLRQLLSRALHEEPAERPSPGEMHNALTCYLMDVKPPYGAHELAQEAAGVLMEAADLGRPAPQPGAVPDNLH
ncbi:protein kinase [Archangium violaceum]|uniref:protein kinase domain-containing protein n=1 Tax=Archangium violaceum TaxID=83451 RepID=UPI00193B40A5|nr:protein kinase [Archangium violaceum]QRK05259.1 protein kinase [Archangium violaceum]